jgi:quinol monooxygenase YgiN
MILELVDIHILLDQQAEFELALQRGVDTVISKALGCCAYKINKSLESPGRYILMIYWKTLENHTVDFRQGPLFAEWRALVGPYFAVPPQIEHFTLLGASA